MQLQFQVGIDPPDRIFFGDVHSGSSCQESFIQYVIHIFRGISGSSKDFCRRGIPQLHIKNKNTYQKRHTAAVTGKSTLRILMSRGEN